MVAIFVIAVVAQALLFTFVLPELRREAKGVKRFGGMGEISRGNKVVGGIHCNGRPLPY
jgi:hypothetical protein